MLGGTASPPEDQVPFDTQSLLQTRNNPWQMCIHTQRYPGAHMHLFAYTHMLPYTHTHTYTRSHAYTRTHTLPYAHIHVVTHAHILTRTPHQGQTPLSFLDTSGGILPTSGGVLPKVKVPAGMDQYLSFAAGPCCPVCPSTFVPQRPYVRERVCLCMIACVDAKHVAGTDVSLCVDVDAFAETAATSLYR